MSNASVISICNRSLLSIGARAQISDLNEGSTESDACNVLFAPTFEMLARSAHWNCLRKQIVLTLLAAAEGTPENVDGTTLPLPPVPWLYQYALPSDCLQVRSLVPSFASGSGGGIPISQNLIGAPYWVPDNGQIPYAVAYALDSNNSPINVILTNLTQAQAIYTVNQPNPAIWDSMFQQAMVASLAAYLVPALSLNLPLMDRSIKAADAIITQARVRDGNEGVTCVDHVPDFIRARGVGAYTYGYGGWGYSSMIWPGGY